jgi:hypothetical protein
MRLVFVLLASVLAATRPLPVRACSVVGPQPFEIDAAMAATDRQPPALTGLAVTNVKRGRAPENTGCGSTGTSCDDLGWIGILPAVTDDHTPAGQLGYLVSLVRGQLPEGLALPPQTFALPGPNREMTLFWLDGNTDDQESFDFTLSVVAIDLAGNESAPMQVHIGNDGKGCSVTWFRRPTTAALTLALLALATLTRRRSPAGTRRH